MPQEPKKRHSRARKGKRRASIHLNPPKGLVCPNCQNFTLQHQICRSCGYYKGKEIITKKLKKEKQITHENTP